MSACGIGGASKPQTLDDSRMLFSMLRVGEEGRGVEGTDVCAGEEGIMGEGEGAHDWASTAGTWRRWESDVQLGVGAGGKGKGRVEGRRQQHRSCWPWASNWACWLLDVWGWLLLLLLLQWPVCGRASYENLSSCSFPGYAAPLHTLLPLPLLPLCLACRHSAFRA